MQGYLLSKPIDGEAMRDLIEEIYERGLGAQEGAAEPESARLNLRNKPFLSTPTPIQLLLVLSSKMI